MEAIKQSKKKLNPGIPPNNSGFDPMALSRAAIDWYRACGRDLPWRRTSDPYAVLVSELMLQQTTVAAVVGYFERFLQRFPEVQSLAEAGEQEVLAQWAGLGYYRRARLLQSAARAIVERHGGVFPSEVDVLQRLPGVGRYTAGAIASFAFDQPAPIVEANTARLMARLFAIKGQLSDAAVVKRLWESAAFLLPSSGGCEHNSALMDLGALVCTPVRPRCGECPLESWCAARRLGLTDTIPPPKIQPEKVARAFAGVVVQWGTRFLVRRIPQGEWHAGMYEFPKVPTDPGSSTDKAESAVRSALRPYCTLVGLHPFAELRYVVTRHTVTLTVLRGRARAGSAGFTNSSEKELPGGEFRWMTLAEISRLPLGSAQRRLLRLLADHNDLFGKTHE